MYVCMYVCIYVCNVQAQNLNLDWAKNMGGIGAESGESVATDNLGNVYTLGLFEGTVDFDPSPNIFNLTAIGSRDIFVNKINSAGQFVWAIKIGGAGYENSKSVAVDNSGNVYITGYFDGTLDLDPSSNIFNLTSFGNFDIFVSKLDTQGNFLWAKNMGGIGADYSFSITIDITGNIYTTGGFSRTADFDPSGSVFNLIATSSPSGNYDDVFVSKLSSNGIFIWAKQLGGATSDGGIAITTDNVGNVYTAGLFGGTADFDPNAGIFNLTSAGSSDVFVSKLSNNGSFIWAKRWGGVSSDNVSSIKVNSIGNVHTLGSFENIVDFDPNASIFNLTSVGGSDIYITQLNSSGSLMWAKNMGSIGDDGGSSVHLDAQNNIYTTGWFNGIADFDPNFGTYNLSSAGNSDIFISKLDASGIFLEASTIGGISNDIGNSIVLDVYDNVHIVGGFQATADFDPTINIFNLTSVASTDIFIAKYVLCPNINITTTNLLGGSVGTNYNQSIFQVGLINPSWNVISGTLPNGLTLNITTGQIIGTPTSVGTFNFTIEARNGSCRQTKSFFISICPQIIISPFGLPSSTIGTSYNQVLTQTGLLGATTWQFISGTLPQGLTFDATTAIISGNTTAQGLFCFEIGVYDNSCTKTKRYCIDVACQATPIVISPATLPNGSLLNIPYNQTLTQSGLSTPITWSVINGSLPNGLSLDQSTGAITGTPTIGGESSFTVQVRNNNCAQTQDYTITTPCSDGKRTIFTPNTPQLQDGIKGVNYSQTISQIGLGSPTTWSVILGSLPNGLTLNTTTGEISGVATNSGQFCFTLNAVALNSNGGGCESPRQFCITICHPTKLQTIYKFKPIPNMLFGTTPFSLNAVSTHNTPITYTSNNLSVATISGNSVTIVGIGYVCITASAVCAPSITQCFNVTPAICQICGPIDERIVVNEVFIYPNPTKGVFEVEFTKNYPELVVKIINTSGVMVLENVFKVSDKTTLENSNEKIKLNISHLPAGLYLIQLNNGKELKIKKIIKE